MSKKSNQKLKLLYLAKILREKTDDDHGLSLKEIIDELDKYGIAAERKSLYDDFESLREFGIDVEKDGDGSKTRYYIAERDFELPELKILVDSVQTSKFISKAKSEKLIKKIESLASDNQAKELNRQVYVQNRVKSQNELALHTIDRLHTAINENRKVSFKYFDWNEKKEKEYRHNGKIYRISPWALIESEDKYYVISYDDETKGEKTFRIDKMDKMEILDEKREGMNIFQNVDIAQYETRAFGMYSGNLEKVTLEVKKEALPFIIDRFGLDIIIIPKGDNICHVVVNVFVSPVFLTWVMNFGERVKILSPLSAKEKLIAIAKEALRNYE